MSISPATLQEESEEERDRRQQQTGVLSNGLKVVCFPNLDDPMVSEIQHRAVCLTRPYSACEACCHATFTLIFKKDRTEKFIQVACPRWDSEQARILGLAPDFYVPTEEATCDTRPFSFCSSCPSRQTLEVEYGTDKMKDGWFGRWNRLRRKEFEDE